MILVYVCPVCQEIRIVSRRKNVKCIHCSNEMMLSDLTFLEWSEMGLEKRKEYAAKWCSSQKRGLSGNRRS